MLKILLLCKALNFYIKLSFTWSKCLLSKERVGKENMKNMDKQDTSQLQLKPVLITENLITAQPCSSLQTRRITDQSFWLPVTLCTLYMLTLTSSHSLFD